MLLRTRGGFAPPEGCTTGLHPLRCGDGAATAGETSAVRGAARRGISLDHHVATGTVASTSHTEASDI